MDQGDAPADFSALISASICSSWYWCWKVTPMWKVMLIQLGLDLRKLLIHRPTKISEILLNGLQDPQNHVIWFRHGTGSPVTPWFNLW
jgi:hypothetical protein